MTDQKRDAALGAALTRLVDLALADDTLRDGLLALTALITERLSAHDRVPAMAEVLTDAEPREVDRVVPSDAVLPPGAAGVETSVGEVETPATPTPPRRKVSQESVPMDRGALLALVEGAMRGMSAGDRGPFADALLGSRAATPSEEPQLEPPPGSDEADDADAALPGIVTRCRLRAAVARDAAERTRSGAPIADDRVHRARSEGASLWFLELLDPDPSLLQTLGECLDAVADAAEAIVLLRRYEPSDQQRRASAVRDLAAVQSALRIAALALRQSPDDDQLAAFTWLKATTAAERLYVDRHMRLDDPLDPAQLPGVMDAVHDGLTEFKARAEREGAMRKRYQTLKYVARQLREGRAGSRDQAKLTDTVDALVVAGVPPSSLQFRTVLMPVLDRLPVAEGQPVGYGRVFAELQAHAERIEARAIEPEESDAPQDPGDALAAAVTSPSHAVRLARQHLDRVVIPDSAIETIGEIDSAEESPAWGRSTWRALRALDAYARDADGAAGFWSWCANSGDPHAWPATTKKLAMNESDTAMQTFGDDRRFKVDPRVDPSGEIVMEAHCKIAEGGGPLAPRVYFYDDTKGATGLIHVGFIGPHRYVRNASTN